MKKIASAVLLIIASLFSSWLLTTLLINIPLSIGVSNYNGEILSARHLKSFGMERVDYSKINLTEVITFNHPFLSHEEYTFYNSELTNFHSSKRFNYETINDKTMLVERFPNAGSLLEKVRKEFYTDEKGKKTTSKD